MAYAPENMLSTPQGYATPEQLQSLRQYATALQSPGEQQPVRHWTQGVDNVVKSLMGGYLSNQADARQRATLGAAADAQRPPAPYQGVYPGTSAPSPIVPRPPVATTPPITPPNPFLAQWPPPVMDAGIYPAAMA